MKEILSKRTRQSKTHDLENGKYQLVMGVGPCHYKDSEDAWRTIDNTMYPSTHPDYVYENGVNDFKVYFKDDLSKKDAIRFEKDGAASDLTILGMALYDASQDKYIMLKSPKRSLLPVIIGRKIVFQGVYDDVELSYILTPSGIKEYVEVFDISSIPDPTTIGYDPESTYLAMVTEWIHDCDEVHDALGPITEKREIGEIHFVKNQKECFYSPHLIGFESTPEKKPDKMKKRVKIQDKKITMFHGVLYTDLLLADALPYIIDTSVITSITDGDDDGQEVSSATWQPDGTNITMGNEYSKGDVPYDGAFRFLNITIPNSTTIDTAFLTLVADNANSDTGDTEIKAVDEDNCAAWSQIERPSQRLKTLAMTEWANPTQNGGDVIETPDFASVIQEVVDRTGWASGNNIGIICINKITGVEVLKYYAAYEHVSYDPVELTITYASAGNVVTFVSSMLGDSDIAAPDLNVLRRIISSISGDSLSSDDATLTLIKTIVSSMSGDSLTSDDTVLLSMVFFTSTMSGDSDIADAAFNVLRKIATSQSGDSSIADPGLIVLRKFVSSMEGSSLTSDDALLLSMVTFVSAMAGDSSIADPALIVLRKIVTAIQAESETTIPDLGIIRQFVTSMVGASETSTIPELILLIIGLISSPTIEDESTTLSVSDVSVVKTISDISAVKTIEDVSVVKSILDVSTTQELV